MGCHCSLEGFGDFLRRMAACGYFEDAPKRHPRVRLFSLGPAIDFLTHRCRWLFTAPAVVWRFVLLAGVRAG